MLVTKNIEIRDQSSQSLSSFKQHISGSLDSFDVFNALSTEDKFKLLIKNKYPITSKMRSY